MKTTKTQKVSDLRSVREASGLTATSVARLMGVSQPAVSRMESGAHRSLVSSLTSYYAACGRHDLVVQLGTLPGQQIDSDTLDAAMRWEARYGQPVVSDPVMDERLDGRYARVRDQAARGLEDRKRLLGDLESLSRRREADAVRGSG